MGYQLYHTAKIASGTKYFACFAAFFYHNVYNSQQHFLNQGISFPLLFYFIAQNLQDKCSLTDLVFCKQFVKLIHRYLYRSVIYHY